MRRLGIAAVILVAFFAASSCSEAQVPLGFAGYTGPGAYGPYGPGAYAPNGAYVYPFVAWPGFRGAYGSYWTNGLSLYGPPVPVAGPVPGVFGNGDLVNQWRAAPAYGVGVGVVIPLGQRHRFPYPLIVEPLPPLANPNPSGSSASGFISVKLPQPTAEIFIGGLKMRQTGTDRTFTTPPLALGKEFRYEVKAQWFEHGAVTEATRIVAAKAGEVVRVNFTK